MVELKAVVTVEMMAVATVDYLVDTMAVLKAVVMGLRLAAKTVAQMGVK